MIREIAAQHIPHTMAGTIWSHGTVTFFGMNQQYSEQLYQKSRNGAATANHKGIIDVTCAVILTNK